MSDFWIGPVAAPDTYRLVSLLGGGGEGEVWKAVLPLSSEGRRSVAIKITRAKGDQGDWERFGHLLRSLSHPGLVRITDVFTGPAMHRQGEIAAGDGADGNNLRYVVMDYIDGINLREWSAEKPETTVSQRLRLLGMVAAALDEMHSGATTEVAVAHGDVKPANIVVRSDGAAILVDLGLARLADAGGVPGRSAAYAAPELRSRGALATPGADRYAFAVTTAHLLTGQAPPIGEDGWLDTQALRALLESSPLTARRHLLIQRIMTMISAPPEARTSQLRPWLDAAVESLSQATSTGLSAVAAPPVDSPTQPPRTVDTPAPPTPEASKSEDAGRGEQFGPYRLERLLGRGGMGEVYRALDTGRNRVVALKRLPAAMADDPEFKARFREESRLAAQLNEPHIIPIHDFGEINGHLFIDMRLVEGTDLAHLLADTGALSPARAVHIVRQVADALDSAHVAGLVHRDVKPANILLRSAQTDTTDFDDGNDFAYLVDFGIARATSDPGLTGTGGAIGSVTYMAPERFHGHSDHRADIYSLGCLLYEAVTAHRPFDVTDTAAAIHAHLYNEPPRPSAANPSVPVALDAVIAKAMAKDPDQRYATAGALAAAARSALTLSGGPPVPDAADAGTTHIPPGAHPEPHYWTDPPTMPIDLRLTAAPTPSATTPPLASKSNRRSLALAGALVALLVLAIAGIGAYRFLTARAPTPPNGPTLSVAQEPIQTPGADPFMPSVGKDVPNTRQPPGSHGVYDGGTPGLYGGTLNNAECDRPSMISFLQTNPDKAAAWATVENISPTDVPAYINQLTPVILRGDTAVTNHGFKDGHPTTLQSVLQTGTAVLVDPFGVPRARCYCGNPLSPPDRPNNANYAPPAWPLFNPSNVLTSHPHGAPLIEFTLIDLTTNTPIHRPTGTSGEKDLPQQPPPPPATTAAPPHPRVPVPVTHTPTHPITRPTEEPVQPSPRKCPDGYKLVDDECEKKSTGGGSESNTTTPPPPSINPCDHSNPSTYDPKKC